jgi:hypothetical protein
MSNALLNKKTLNHHYQDTRNKIVTIVQKLKLPY